MKREGVEVDGAQNVDTTKKPYEKPKLEVIDLAAEEVLANACKMGQTVGPNRSPCEIARCARPGS